MDVLAIIQATNVCNRITDTEQTWHGPEGAETPAYHFTCSHEEYNTIECKIEALNALIKAMDETHRADYDGEMIPFIAEEIEWHGRYREIFRRALAAILSTSCPDNSPALAK